MRNNNHRFTHRLAGTAAFIARIGCGVAALMLLNGCAALAVSLAGAGAGAGLSHQMNGTASRTFTEPLDKLDAATQIAAKRMFLSVEDVSTIDSGQITKARVSDMDVTVVLQTLSPTLTRVEVTARKDLFRVDGATAQEIVTQIERALVVVEQADAAAAAKRTRKVQDARFINSAPANARQGSSPSRQKNAI